MATAENFVNKHPWMTFFLGLFAISGTVAIVQSASGTRVLGGVLERKPKQNPGQLPPRQVRIRWKG